MKKIIALLLTLVLALTVVACGKKASEPADDNTTADNESVVDTEEVAEDSETDEAPAVDTPAVEGDSVAQTLVSEFKALAAEGKTTQEIADALVASQVLSPVGMMTMPIEENLLSGFDNYEVNGFAECVMFAPMIGTIPFVGYVFTVGDGVDAAAFAADLEANANLRWNICVAAEEIATAVEGNQVMFVMAPMSFEAEQPEDMVQDDIMADMGDVEVPAAFDGEMAE